MSALILALMILIAPAQDAGGDESYAYLMALAQHDLHAEVVREGRAFLRDHPRDAHADHVRYRIGCALQAENHDEEAAALFAPLTERAGFELRAEACVRAGECALALGALDTAETMLARTIASDKVALHGPALLLRSRVRVATGRFAEARADAESLLEQAGDDATKHEARTTIAWCDLKLGRPQDAERAARAELARPGIAADAADELRVILGEALLDLDKPDDALALFDAVTTSARSAAAQRGRGFALASLGRHAEAAAAFERSARDDRKGPAASECALHAGIEQLSAGDAHTARALLVDPRLDDSADALEWRARAEFADGDPGAALATIDRALALPALSSDQRSAERTARLQRARGEALQRLGRSAEATRSFAASGTPGALLQAAAASLSAGDAESALQSAHALVALDLSRDEAVQGWLAIGEANFRLKRWKEAEEAYERSAGLDPDKARAARAHLRAAWARHSGGDPAGAAELAQSAARALDDEKSAEEARFLAARDFESAGDNARAAHAWSDFLASHSRSAHVTEARLHLARLLPAEDGDRLLEAALGNDTTSGTALVALELAERRSHARRWSDARTLYERALAAELPPESSAAARYGLAWCLHALGDDEHAESTLASIPSAGLAPELESAILELRVVALTQRGDAAKALEIWRALGASGDPKRALELLRPLASLLQKQGRAADADRAFDALAQRAGGDDVRAQIEIERAWLGIDTGDIAGADEHLQRATRGGADAAHVCEASFSLAETANAHGDRERAQRLYVSAQSAASPVLDRALYRSAFTHLAAGDANAAETELARLVRDVPKSPLLAEALFLRGEALFRLGRFEDALVPLDRVRRELASSSVLPRALFRSGLALVALSRWREGADTLAELGRAAPQFENRAEAELARGRALVQLGDVRGARSALERPIEAGGALAARARVVRAKLARTSGDLESALSDALKAALLSNDSESAPEALWIAGDILAEQNELEAARARFAELIEKYGANPFATQARARLAALSEKRPGGEHR